MYIFCSMDLKRDENGYIENYKYTTYEYDFCNKAKCRRAEQVHTGIFFSTVDGTHMKQVPKNDQQLMNFTHVN